MPVKKKAVAPTPIDEWAGKVLREEIAPSREGTFGDILDEFHYHLATHGHPPGNPFVAPGSAEAVKQVTKTFKDVDKELLEARCLEHARKSKRKSRSSKTN